MRSTENGALPLFDPTGRIGMFFSETKSTCLQDQDLELLTPGDVIKRNPNGSSLFPCSMGHALGVVKAVFGSCVNLFLILN